MQFNVQGGVQCMCFVNHKQKNKVILQDQVRR